MAFGRSDSFCGKDILRRDSERNRRLVRDWWMLRPYDFAGRSGALVAFDVDGGLGGAGGGVGVGFEGGDGDGVVVVGGFKFV